MEEEYFNPNNVKKSENLENLYGLNKSSDRFSTKESNL